MRTYMMAKYGKCISVCVSVWACLLVYVNVHCIHMIVIHRYIRYICQKHIILGTWNEWGQMPSHIV